VSDLLRAACFAFFYSNFVPPIFVFLRLLAIIIMISVSPKKSFRLLGFIILVLSSANLLINFIKCFLGRGRLWGMSRLFDFDIENNIPTWYSSIALFICAGLLAFIAYQKGQQGDRFFKHWRGLSLIFLWLSMDEAASIHETLIGLNTLLKADGFFRYAWVIPAIPLLIVFGLTYRKFLVALPQKIKQLFLLAAALYITGGLVMEMVGGKYLQIFALELPVANNSGLVGMGMALILAAEEALEMCGVAVFIYALLCLISQEENTLHFSQKSHLQIK
jgi:hypothetical protein